MFKITRRFEFDAGHRLLNYNGPCARLHGHHYVVEVTVAGEKLDELGMLMDFGEVKKYVKPLLELWDHRTLLNENDPLCIELMHTGDLVSTEINPTAEMMAEHIFTAVKDLMSTAYKPGGHHAKVLNVRVYETPDNWCDFSSEG